MSKFGKVFIVIGLFAAIFAVYLISSRGDQSKSANQVPPVLSAQHNQFSYKGKDGIDALTLLKNQAKIEQNNTGLVTSINGRKADSTKHEYWGFYVNYRLSDVGPSDYKTKDSDVIEWRIEQN